MNKLVPIIPLMILSIVPSAAQEYPAEFGKVSQDEINLVKYAKDPAAEAVILFDIGDSRFIDSEQGYDIEFTRIKRIKIFTKPGIKYAEVSIPYYIDEHGRAETIKTIEAYSYNLENGQVNRSSLNLATVYDEKINSRWNQKKFVIPDVKPGSVLEFRYVLQTPFQFNLPNWKFQDHIPTIFSKYVVRMIPFYEYAFILQGTNKFDLQTTIKDPENRVFGSLSQSYGQDIGWGVRFQDLVSTYVLKDVPAFRDESYITSDDDYLIKIDFQLAKFISPRGGTNEIISTWPKLVDELLKSDKFGKYMKSCDKPARKILETELNLAGKNDTDKCKAIINYVKAGYKWDGGSSIYTWRSQKDFMNQKKGNCADINLFLAALLKAAGLDATPIIISTRDHGHINSNYPFLHYFNYVIILVNLDNKPFLCDGTEYFTTFDRIPPRCINDKGLIIKDQDGVVKWVSLNLGYNSIDNKMMSMEINPETLKAKVRLVLQAAEFDAYVYKKNFSDDTLQIKKFLNESGIPVINKVSTMNFEKNELPYSISCDGEAEIEQLNDKLIISPFLSFYPKQNKLTQPTRTYPVDLTYSNTESYNCEINIPDGYRVLTMPDGFNLDNELARINLNYSVAGNIIKIESEFGFKKAVYQPKDYSNIKNYFDIIANKFNEQIVLIKK